MFMVLVDKEKHKTIIEEKITNSTITYSNTNFRLFGQYSTYIEALHCKEELDRCASVETGKLCPEHNPSGSFWIPPDHTVMEWQSNVKGLCDFLKARGVILNEALIKIAVATMALYCSKYSPEKEEASISWVAELIIEAIEKS